MIAKMSLIAEKGTDKIGCKCEKIRRSSVDEKVDTDNLNLVKILNSLAVSGLMYTKLVYMTKFSAVVVYKMCTKKHNHT